MTVSRNTIGALLAPGLMKVMFDDYTKVPQTLLPIFNASSSSKAYEEWVGLTGVGPSEEKPEGQGIVYKDIQQLTPKRITMVTYALGMRCTLEAKQDDQYNQLARLAKIIGKSFPVRREIERANILNTAFTTLLNTGQDGLALISKLHPIKGVGFGSGKGFTGISAGSITDTNITTGTGLPARTATGASNQLFTDSDLDYSSLQDMMVLAARTMDEQGDYVMRTIKNLIVPPELIWIAKELTKSSDRPDTANRSISSVFDLGLGIISSPYLLDSDAWFGICDKSEHDLQWFDRMPYTTDAEDDFDTKDTKLSGIERWGSGFADWRGIVATPGA